ncbi:MAG: DUF1826 domain-containing protein [Methylophilaceae bacterium]|uniref:DUF1826 domain-containing protein n=1 Tax=Methylicorpusculum sp. TaxID=2713644 RepID=UPI00272F14AA|nr:DUF1826 domain-containing protein [Methylicorpusculum sp.]MDP2179240.1 DUF1826 domain-containing protein [Methylicorpusculum sp.]MDP3530022.1 DUF1826 domain-containing protein [Methylicorpusculum sp.]MDZ4099497.1 DUF1826 domain-containing protein [Methylophilaceae bacterium]
MFARVPYRQPLPAVPAFSEPFYPVNSKPTTKVLVSHHLSELSRFYEDDVNLCLIERPQPGGIEQFVCSALKKCGSVEISQSVNPTRFDFSQLWPQASALASYRAWTDDVALLVSAFCELFQRKQASLRLRTLDQAMCPRFHVDRVPARLICSYGGIGTEWLPEYALDRSKLGMGSCGLPDAESGLIADLTAIRQMPTYAVGLMKGENWKGNEGHGLVHRSPTPTILQPHRLLLTLDFL